MTTATKTIEVQVERAIAASQQVVFDAWLDPEIPGNPWNATEKFILDPKVDGLFYWHLRGISHYGRFTQMEWPGSDAAYVGVTEHSRKGIDGDGHLSEARRRHADDSRAFRSP